MTEEQERILTAALNSPDAAAKIGTAFAEEHRLRMWAYIEARRRGLIPVQELPDEVLDQYEASDRA